MRTSSLMRCLVFGLYVIVRNNAHAEDEVCGKVPELTNSPSVNEHIKDELSTQANVLSKYVGQAELKTKIEAAKEIIYTDKYYAAQKDAYLLHLFCVVVQKIASTEDQLKAINQYRSTPTPTYKRKVCIGEHENDCPGPHDAFFTCGYFGSDQEIASRVCSGAPSKSARTNTKSGGRCGYGLIEVTCN